MQKEQDKERKHGPTVTYDENKIKNVFLASGPMGSDKKTPNIHDKKAITPPMGNIFENLGNRA